MRRILYPLPAWQRSSFLPSVEISCIFTRNGKTRKAHCIVLFDDMESALRLQNRLSKVGNISS